MKLGNSQFANYNSHMRTKSSTARRLIALREALGIEQQKDMARICGIKPTMWSLYENGERPLTLQAAFKIIDGTHGAVDLNYLFEGKIDGVRHSLAVKLHRAA
jgi:transcriptional regulator with XRE-family HTH domain